MGWLSQFPCESGHFLTDGCALKSHCWDGSRATLRSQVPALVAYLADLIIKILKYLYDISTYHLLAR